MGAGEIVALQRVRKITEFENFREVENYLICPMLNNSAKRGERLKKTLEAVEKQNDRHAVREVENRIKANFKGGDWWVTLNYSDAAHPHDRDEARKKLKNFLSRLRYFCKKNGLPEPKYGQVTEQGQRSGRWHHHVILQSCLKYEDIEKLWSGNGSFFARRLWSDGRQDKGDDRLNVHRLAEYMVGVSSGKRKTARQQGIRQYSFSRNCVKPKVIYQIMSPKWVKVPKDTAEWMLVPSSLEEYMDGYGLKHQRYVQVRRC